MYIDKQISQWYKKWVYIWLGVNLADIATTIYAIGWCGGKEINPVLGEGIFQIIIIKVIMITLLAIWIYYKERRDIAWFGVGAVSAVVYLNLLQILASLAIGVI